LVHTESYLEVFLFDPVSQLSEYKENTIYFSVKICISMKTNEEMFLIKKI